MKNELTLLDMDFIIRFKGPEDKKERLISARNLKQELEQRGKGKHFDKFVDRAYTVGDNVVCKLRSGIRVEFCLR